MMGFGGNAPEMPAAEPLPEKQAAKSLSAGATAAAQAQRDRRRRNRGLTASILTNRAGAGGLTGTVTGNATLG